MVSEPATQYPSLHGPIADSWNKLQDQIITSGSDLSDNFHNYGMTHTADSITVGVDDTKWGTFTPDSLPAGATWVFNKPFYVILNLAVVAAGPVCPTAARGFPPPCWSTG